MWKEEDVGEKSRGTCRCRKTSPVDIDYQSRQGQGYKRNAKRERQVEQAVSIAPKSGKHIIVQAGSILKNDQGEEKQRDRNHHSTFPCLQISAALLPEHPAVCDDGKQKRDPRVGRI